MRINILIVFITVKLTLGIIFFTRINIYICVWNHYNLESFSQNISIKLIGCKTGLECFLSHRHQEIRITSSNITIWPLTRLRLMLTFSRTIFTCYELNIWLRLYCLTWGSKLKVCEMNSETYSRRLDPCQLPVILLLGCMKQ